VAWTNKFGTHYNLADIAEQLLTRPPEKASCAGTHLLYSLTVLIRVDECEPFLPVLVREKIKVHLLKVVRTLVLSQRDGAWTPAWSTRSESRKPSLHESTGGAAWEDVLVTGHQLEWMILLPSDMVPAKECLVRGANFLLRGLESAAPDTLEAFYCPYSHAARVLRLLTRDDSVVANR
jgi:hypothetical protein